LFQQNSIGDNSIGFAISEVLESSLIFSHHPGHLDEHPTTYAML